MRVGELVAARDLSSELERVDNSQDIAEVVGYVGHELLGQDYLPDDVTACMVLVQGGDYSQVWVTDSCRPYAADTKFCRVR